MTNNYLSKQDMLNVVTAHIRDLHAEKYSHQLRIIEFDASLGFGICTFNYDKMVYQKQVNAYEQTITRLENRTNDCIGIGQVGVRINYLNLIREQKQKHLVPFLKPEITIVKAYKSPILSYSIMLGVNIKKNISLSIGYKYTPMKTIIDNSYTTYTSNTTYVPFTYWNNGVQYSSNVPKITTTSSTSHSYSNSSIGFHNILGKISFEF